MRTYLLKSSINLEVEVGNLYRRLAIYYPQFKNVFEELAKEEENHAMILHLAEEFNVNGLLPENDSEINRALERVIELEKEIEGRTLPLDVIIDRLIELENTMAESLLQEVMQGQEGNIKFLNLKRLYISEKHHAERLKELKELIAS